MRWLLVLLLLAGTARADCPPCPNGIPIGPTLSRLQTPYLSVCECGWENRLRDWMHDVVDVTYCADDVACSVRARSFALASLGTPANGTLLYCSDCLPTNPCTGSGTGVFARREAGAWNCGGSGGTTSTSTTTTTTGSTTTGTGSTTTTTVGPTTTTTTLLNNFLFSMAEAADNNASSTTENETHAVTFFVQRAMNVTGCRFYWRGGTLGAKTIRCRLWKAGVGSQADVDVSAPASDGFVVGTFGSPFAISGSNLNVSFRISMWDTSAAGKVTLLANNGFVPTTGKFEAYPGVIYTNIASWGSGDSEPTSTASSELYPIDPTF